ncbi:hypothetical protein ACFYVR_21730 [Rhodococcus sp. NPDC003318]|uniref:hypothetical protein n=1 Tax=Rhodococcus sp. NPDC003318 TaxID=3364503 RepID=UPI0036C232F1
MHNALRRAGQIAVLTATLGVSIVSAPATAAPPTEHSCPSNLFPDSDLNERYGVSERIIGPPECRQALAGEKWVRAVPPWVAATNADIENFRQNFISARWVTDAGTPREFTVTAGSDSLQGPFTVPSGPFTGRPFVTPVSPAVRPLSVGAHTNVVFVTLREETCNGLGICLPAGESQYDSGFSPVHPVPPVDFAVVAPTN